MYIVDFFTRTLRKSNIAVLIYLALNTAIILILIDLIFSSYFINYVYMNPVGAHLLCIFIGLVIYFVSIAVALSPIGEWILRIQTGSKEIKRKDYHDYLYPLFQEVYAKAKAIDPGLPDDIQLFMNSDKEPNAFATGRKTICLTEGLLSLPPEQIKATFAHEFGHLSHKDTDLLLVISVGNFIVTAIVIIGKVLMNIFTGIMTIGGLMQGGREGIATAFATWLLNLIFIVFIAALSKVWTMIGVALCMKSSRDNEFEADEFAARLGYQNELCAALDTIDGGSAKGIFATFASTHPDKNDRIARLQQYSGADYYTTFPVPKQPSEPSVGNRTVFSSDNKPDRASYSGSVPPSAGGTVPPSDHKAVHSNIVICNSCGSVIKEGMRFCVKCGTPAVAVNYPQTKKAQFCTHCGAPRNNNARYCTKCGHAFRVQ